VTVATRSVLACATGLFLRWINALIRTNARCATLALRLSGGNRDAYFYGDDVRVVHPDGTGGKTIVKLPRAGFIIRRQLEFRELPVWSPDSAHLLLNVLMTEEYGMDVLMVDLPSLHKKTVFKNATPIIGWAQTR
jgi:hypothetical protein